MNAPDRGFERVTLAADDQPDDEIIVTVRQGLDETARWWLQRPQSDWQIAQIAEDLEDHLVGLVEAHDPRKDNQ